MGSRLRSEKPHSSWQVSTRLGSNPSYMLEWPETAIDALLEEEQTAQLGMQCIWDCNALWSRVIEGAPIESKVETS